MRIKITGSNTYEVIGADLPTIGEVYELESTTSGTNAQNRAFHALVAEYYKSGCGSYDAQSFDQFRDQIKRSLGEGFEGILWSESPVHIVASSKDVPDHIILKAKTHVRGKLKSWSDYTKKQRRETMDKLISEMHQVGVQSKKFREILEGMEGLWR